MNAEGEEEVPELENLVERWCAGAEGEYRWKETRKVRIEMEGTEGRNQHGNA